MQCPTCDETLLMADRQGVEIDYCPKCRGIWLDRGELEKLIERSVGSMADVRKEAVDRNEGDFRSGQQPRVRDDLRDERNRPKKKESWFSDFFDFG